MDKSPVWPNKKHVTQPLIAMMKRWFVLALLAACLTMTGCPDRSHLRSVPDYKNMTDEGTENPPR